MGVTIHFRGRARDRACLDSLLLVARNFAMERGWEVATIDEPNATIGRVDENEKACDYNGPAEGVELRPSADCEPVRLEFGSDLVVDDWTKTQFAGADAHVTVIQLLRLIEPYFESFQVRDEAKFWDTGDGELLKKYLTDCDTFIEDYRREHPTAKVKVKQADGRIVDIITYD